MRDFVTVRIDVQFSRENSRSRHRMRGFHAECGEFEPKRGRALEAVMSIGATVVMIAFIGLLLKALG